MTTSDPTVAAPPLPSSGRLLPAAGAALFAAVLLAVVAAPLLTPYDADQQDLTAALQGPGAAHWLGTDDYGRDVLTRLLHGGQVSLLAAGQASLVALVVGVPAGLLAGYRGGWLDSLLSRIFDALLSVPAIVLVATIVAITGPDLTSSMTAVGIVLSPRFFRVQRATTLAVRQETFIEAAESVGCSQTRLLLRHVLPNTAVPTVVQIPVTFGTAIIAEASVSFLGLGAQPPTSTWGSMLRDAYRHLDGAPHLVIPPGVLIMICVLSILWISDGARRALSRKDER